MKFIREKKIKFGCGYLDVDIYEMDDSFTPPVKKSKRKRISPPHIIAANERHSRNNLRQLIMHNFGAGDYYLTTTYAGKAPPIEEAQKQIGNFINRLKRLYAKYGIELRAIYVTEGGRPKENGGFTRVHHHIVINGGVPREEVERAWNGRQPKDAETKRGFCNCALIQPQEDERGCERIAEYMTKSRTKNLGKGLHRWNGTRNLKRPKETMSDGKLSRKQTAALISAVKQEQSEALRRIVEKRYGREAIDVISSVNPVTGRVYVSVRFRQEE